jgi:transposase
MTQLIKHVVGIDISKDKFDVCFGSIDTSQTIKLSSPKEFKSTPKGFEEFLNWVLKRRIESTPIWFVMEATGIYYENLAYYLSEQNQKVNIVLPTKTKHYKQTTEIKTKNDKIDSQIITRYGLEKQLEEWKIPDTKMRYIKEMSREHETLNDQATQIKNQIHAKKNSYKPNESTLKRLIAHLKLLESQQKDIESELRKTVLQIPEVARKIGLIEDSLKGVGFMTIIKIIAETNGFACISNAKQLTSYAGLDIVENQSGNKQGKTSISSKGNSHLRRCLYMPSMSVVKYITTFKNIYLRLIQKKGNGKVALTAVMRKLLSLIYSLWKNNVPFDPDYHMKKAVCLIDIA